MTNATRSKTSEAMDQLTKFYDFAMKEDGDGRLFSVLPPLEGVEIIGWSPNNGEEMAVQDIYGLIGFIDQEFLLGCMLVRLSDIEDTDISLRAIVTNSSDPQRTLDVVRAHVSDCPITQRPSLDMDGLFDDPDLDRPEKVWLTVMRSDRPCRFNRLPDWARRIGIVEVCEFAPLGYGTSDDSDKYLFALDEAYSRAYQVGRMKGHFTPKEKLELM